MAEKGMYSDKGSRRNKKVKMELSAQERLDVHALNVKKITTALLKQYQKAYKEFVSAGGNINDVLAVELKLWEIKKEIEFREQPGGSK